jgi:hypothetical protein
MVIICMSEHQAAKGYMWAAEKNSYVLNSALIGSEWSASGAARVSPSRLGGWWSKINSYP